MTAVQKFIEQITHFIDRTKISDTMLHNLVEEHLEMEKQQIIEAFDEAEGKIIGRGEQYYNKIFKPTK